MLEKAAIFSGWLNYKGKFTQNTRLLVRGSATARLIEGESKRLRFSHSQVQNECSFIVSDTLSLVSCFITHYYYYYYYHQVSLGIEAHF